MGAAVGDRIVAFAGVVGAVCRDAADLLTLWDLVEKVGQDRCIANVASGDLDSPDFQGFLVNPEMDSAPDPPFGGPMLAGVPLTFALDLDPGAIDQQVQRPLGAAIGDVHGKGLLASG